MGQSGEWKVLDVRPIEEVEKVRFPNIGDIPFDTLLDLLLALDSGPRCTVDTCPWCRTQSYCECFCDWEERGTDAKMLSWCDGGSGDEFSGLPGRLRTRASV